MSTWNKYKIAGTFLLFWVLMGSSLFAQPVKQLTGKNALHAEILHMDSVLFNAFNTRNLAVMKELFTPDLEVYQDNVGVRNYSETMHAFEDLFTKEYILKRELIASSLEVYPLKDFGAIQTGLHTFCHTENGKLQCGTFKFMHVWEKNKGTWQIKRLITYDH